MVQIAVPDDSIAIYEIPQLPGNWRDAPAPVHTQDFGTCLLQARENLLIKIPSTIVPQEFNYLVNPLHASFSMLKIIAVEDFVFDPRIKL